MNMNQHRKLTVALQAEAGKIHVQLAAEGRGGTWTGQVRVFGQSVWHEFNTANGLTYYRFNTANGLTYYRFPAVGDGPLKSRVAEPQQYDGLGDFGYPGLDLQG